VFELPRQFDPSRLVYIGPDQVLEIVLPPTVLGSGVI
jgi:hypothetical protein